MAGAWDGARMTAMVDRALASGSLVDKHAPPSSPALAYVGEELSVEEQTGVRSVARTNGEPANDASEHRASTAAVSVPRVPRPTVQARKFSIVQAHQLEALPQLQTLPASERLAMRAVAAVLPFRVNPYVIEELIDWSDVPDDPMFQLTFPQRGMLEPAAFDTMYNLLRRGASADEVKAAARAIQVGLNPHPAGQKTMNVPELGGEHVRGMQHKYRETVLFFPSQGQTCHAYCTYCFRWPQFVGLDDMQFASKEVDDLIRYLRARPEVTSVLFTGGDPLVMRTKLLRRYIEPLLAADLPNLASIRLGTKSTAYWPFRFLTDPDADDLLRLFEEVEASGKHVALMAHSSHARELETPAAQAAFRRIRSSGAVVRCQAPLIRRVNDDPIAWAELWRLQVQLGAVPYYMFVERDTGPRNYFEVPLHRAVQIFREAQTRVSGLARTARGPSMSATPGKVSIDGVARVAGEDVFVLRLLQARDPAWADRPFFAKYDEDATWFDQLRPAFDEDAFFFEPQLRRAPPMPWRQPPLARRHLPVFTAEERPRGGRDA